MKKEMFRNFLKDEKQIILCIYFRERKKEMFRNFSKDRKTNCIFYMLQGGKEEQNVDKWKDSFTGFLSFFF